MVMRLWKDSVSVIPECFYRESIVFVSAGSPIEALEDGIMKEKLVLFRIVQRSDMYKVESVNLNTKLTF